jgi:DNA-binding MarR family transcriptional regulator
MTTLRAPKETTASVYQEAFLSIARTDTALRDGIEKVLAPRGLSFTQYNVLRILRRAGADGLCRNDIRDRLLSRMPDTTRLLDRMEAAGLISRVRSSEDRRLVNTTLTGHGRDLVDELDELVAVEHERQFSRLNKGQLRTLIQLLTLVRESA